MADTTIEWTDATWNPVAGCAIVSPGCTNCYAMRMAARLEAMGVDKYRGLTRKSGGRAKWTGRLNLDHDSLLTPIGWRKPRRIFVNSMSDMFHPDVPDAFLKAVWQTMAATPHHTYQILTKRPELMATRTAHLPMMRHVWLGTSVESADYLSRLDALRTVRAFVRFVSFEPLLGSVAPADLSGIHWAIVGGESGPKARPMDPAWVEEIEAACRDAGAAFFFKQWGGTQKKRSGRQLRGRTFDEMPAAYSSISV